MRRWLFSAVVAATLAFTPGWLQAQTKPANATAECKDGTYSTAKSKQGACSGHGGIKTWYADEKGGVKADTKAAAKSTKDAATSAGKATGSAGKAVGKGAATAGKATGNAAETAAKDTKDATKTAAKATGNAASATANAIKPKPSDAPPDATAKCKDGSYSHATQHRGACSGHGGVAEWYK